MENQLQADFAPIFQPATVQELVEFLREHPEQKVASGRRKHQAFHVEVAWKEKRLRFRCLRSRESSTISRPILRYRGSGTKVESLNRSLSECGQFLPFDPPFASSGATVGGVVALV